MSQFLELLRYLSYIVGYKTGLCLHKVSQIQETFSGSNTDDPFTTAVSNSLSLVGWLVGWLVVLGLTAL